MNCSTDDYLKMLVEAAARCSSLAAGSGHHVIRMVTWCSTVTGCVGEAKGTGKWQWIRTTSPPGSVVLEDELSLSYHALSLLLPHILISFATSHSRKPQCPLAYSI